MDAKDLTIQQAADQLGVHYMTAYRYVRLGMIPGHKAGSTWHIDAADLHRFRAQGRPSALQEGLRGGVSGATRPKRPSARPRPAQWAERYEARLLGADGSGAWGVLEAALTAGADVEQLYLHVIAPALRSIGRRWVEGEIDIADEHVASAITLRAMSRLSPRFTRPGPKASVVMSGAPGDQHSVPLAMVADLLTGAGSM